MAQRRLTRSPFCWATVTHSWKHNSLPSRSQICCCRKLVWLSPSLQAHKPRFWCWTMPIWTKWKEYRLHFKYANISHKNTSASQMNRFKFGPFFFSYFFLKINGISESKIEGRYGLSSTWMYVGFALPMFLVQIDVKQRLSNLKYSVVSDNYVLWFIL